MSLGLETRNLHLERGANEEYTKLYVFDIQDADKVTHGAFSWGKNFEQFTLFEEIRALAENIWDEITEKEVRWLSELSENQKLMVWTQQDHTKYVFVTNLDPNNRIDEHVLREVTFNHPLNLLFDTSHYSSQHECRVYKLS